MEAAIPVVNSAVSMTLAWRAIKQRSAFTWSPPAATARGKRIGKTRIPKSTVEHNIQSAIYAPLMWKGKALGVVCVDNHEASGAFSRDDVRLLQALAHHAAMTIGHLETEERLRNKTKILSNFLKLVSPQLAKRLTRYRGPIRLGGEFREATILFSDIRGFTNLSSRMEPEEVIDMIGEYFGELVPIIFKYQGMIDKFVGDAIVAVFGSPDTDPRQHQHAVQAGLKMQSAMRKINKLRKSQRKVTAELGIGIHCGEVVHGFVGSGQRMEFTVIGDAVNMSSRYCDGAGGGEILLSPKMRGFVWRFAEVEKSSIQNKEGRLEAFSLRGLRKVPK